MRTRVKVKNARITPRARQALEESKESIGLFLSRHAEGDWGEVDDATKQANDQALRQKGSVFSFFTTAKGARLCLVTEAGRKRTTALLAEEIVEVLDAQELRAIEDSTQGGQK